MSKARHTKTEQRERIVLAFIEAAEAGSYLTVTREDVARRLGMSRTLINHYYGAFEGLTHTAMARAVTDGNLTIIAQGLAHGDPIARSAPGQLVEAALRKMKADSVKRPS